MCHMTHVAPGWQPAWQGLCHTCGELLLGCVDLSMLHSVLQTRLTPCSCRPAYNSAALTMLQRGFRSQGLVPGTAVTCILCTSGGVPAATVRMTVLQRMTVVTRAWQLQQLLHSTLCTRTLQPPGYQHDHLVGCIDQAPHFLAPGMIRPD